MQQSREHLLGQIVNLGSSASLGAGTSRRNRFCGFLALLQGSHNELPNRSSHLRTMIKRKQMRAARGCSRTTTSLSQSWASRSWPWSRKRPPPTPEEGRQDGKGICTAAGGGAWPIKEMRPRWCWPEKDEVEEGEGPGNDQVGLLPPLLLLLGSPIPHPNQWEDKKRRGERSKAKEKGNYFCSPLQSSLPSL